MSILRARGISPYIMKFLLLKFIAPSRTGRYGTGDMAARGTAIFPYLFVRSVNLFTDFSEAIAFTASNIYFFPNTNPISEPIVDPKIVAIIAE